MVPTETGHATEADIQAAKDKIKESNDDRQREKLRRQVARAHAWRVQVWAQSELKIRQANAALGLLGTDPVEVYKPDFESEERLNHYANMALPK